MCFPRRVFPLLLVAGSLSPSALRSASLSSGDSTAYTAVINFDRADYYVADRFDSKNFPLDSVNSLQTGIFFSLNQDAAGNIDLASRQAQWDKMGGAIASGGNRTLGLGSLTNIVGNNTAIDNLATQLVSLKGSHGLRGVDIDWEDMPGVVSVANYQATVSRLATTLRANGITVSTSHGQGAQYVSYAGSVASSVDFVNLQFYYSTVGAYDMATYKSRLTAYVNAGLQASQIRVGLPSYGMVNPGVTGTSDKWRSWAQLVDKGADVTNGTTFTDTNGETYYYSGETLIDQKIAYAKANGFAGVFSWELTQDKAYTDTHSFNRRLDADALGSLPVLDLTDSNAGTGALGTGTVTLGGGAVLNNGVLRFSRTTAATHANRIDGAGSVEVIGATTVTLTGANTYAGGTSIAAGATLQLGDGATTGTAGTGAIANNGTLVLKPGTAADLALTAVISGSGALKKQGAGVLTLGDANTYTGVTTLVGGVTRAGALASGGQASSLGAAGASASNLVFNGGSLIYTGSASASTDRLFTLNTSATISNDGSGTLTFSNAGAVAHTNTGANRTLTLGGSNAGVNTFTSQLTGTGGAGTLALSKSGSGKWILSGSNTYTGGTTVTGGTLLVNNTSGSGLGSAGAVNVAAGATLGGTGSYSAGLTTVVGVLQGGSGSSASGTLTVGGDITFASGSAIALALGAGGARSSLALNGAETFDAAQKFSFTDCGATPGSYSGLISGVLANPGTTAGWTITNEGWSGVFTYNAATRAIDLAVTAVPEPSSYGMLGFGTLATAAFLRRRRR